MPLPPLQLSAGGGGPSGATANNGIDTDLSNPFNFDNSGWNVTINSRGTSQSAQGNQDANARVAPGLLDSLLSGSNTPLMLVGGLALILLLRR